MRTRSSLFAALRLLPVLGALACAARGYALMRAWRGRGGTQPLGAQAAPQRS